MTKSLVEQRKDAQVRELVAAIRERLEYGPMTDKQVAFLCRVLRAEAFR